MSGSYTHLENGQEWHFKTSPGEELLDAAEKLRGYVTGEKGTAPDLFIKLFADGRPITAEEYNALTALRMENTGKVHGVFDLNFDKREFSAVHIMNGWQTWAMRDVSVAAYQDVYKRQGLTKAHSSVFLLFRPQDVLHFFHHAQSLF